MKTRRSRRTRSTVSDPCGRHREKKTTPLVMAWLSDFEVPLTIMSPFARNEQDRRRRALVQSATLSSNAENLVRGMHMLSEDIKAGQGHLKIRQTDFSQFELGRNLEVTPGKVIFQNDLIQLIKYEPTTPTVLKRPC